MSELYNRSPIHMTLEEVRNSLGGFHQQFNSSIADKGGERGKKKTLLPIYLPKRNIGRKPNKGSGGTIGSKINYWMSSSGVSNGSSQSLDENEHIVNPTRFRSTFENMFKSRKRSNKSNARVEEFDENSNSPGIIPSSSSPFVNRALPPLPASEEEEAEIGDDETDRKILDYAASIEKVKDCGWYWGPISGEMGESLLSNEPDGSFIVRDSSDEHYIFSLTFKLNNMVRHVRIEHDQGNFSFGSLQKFTSNTIVDFIENAVQHSRSGRYLFFLHRGPVMGPMRVQLLHPVSRFKKVMSLQHMCRFVILKYVRRDLISQLPLPTRLKSYLNTPHYYSEDLASMEIKESNDGHETND